MVLSKKKQLAFCGVQGNLMTSNVFCGAPRALLTHSHKASILALLGLLFYHFSVCIPVKIVAQKFTSTFVCFYLFLFSDGDVYFGVPFHGLATCLFSSRGTCCLC